MVGAASSAPAHARIETAAPPLVGDLTVEYETLTLPGDPDTTLFVYTTQEGSSSRRAMNLLASWTASTTDTVASHPE
ncbi:hypothetical protein RPX00_39345 [Amycolatopsis sp. WGS_07]